MQSEITESDVGTLEQRDPLKPEPTEIFILFKNICQHFGCDPNPIPTLNPNSTRILTPTLTPIQTQTQTLTLTLPLL